MTTAEVRLHPGRFVLSTYLTYVGDTLKISHDTAVRQRLPRSEPVLTAGVTLKAVDALQHQETFTRAQVAYLIALAYESGRTQSVAEGMAEAVACWAEFADPKATREQRVAARLAEMRASPEREARRPKPSTPLPDCDWPEVAMPGAVRKLQVVA